MTDLQCITFQELSLAGLSLSAFPSEILKSSDVTKINLTGNSIEELPFELRSCVSIEVNISLYALILQN